MLWRNNIFNFIVIFFLLSVAGCDRSSSDEPQVSKDKQVYNLNFITDENFVAGEYAMMATDAAGNLVENKWIYLPGKWQIESEAESLNLYVLRNEVNSVDDTVVSGNSFYGIYGIKSGRRDIDYRSKGRVQKISPHITTRDIMPSPCSMFRNYLESDDAILTWSDLPHLELLDSAYTFKLSNLSSNIYGEFCLNDVQVKDGLKYVYFLPREVMNSINYHKTELPLLIFPDIQLHLSLLDQGKPIAHKFVDNLAGLHMLAPVIDEPVPTPLAIKFSKVIGGKWSISNLPYLITADSSDSDTILLWHFSLLAINDRLTLRAGAYPNRRIVSVNVPSLESMEIALPDFIYSEPVIWNESQGLSWPDGIEDHPLFQEVSTSFRLSNEGRVDIELLLPGEQQNVNFNWLSLWQNSLIENPLSGSTIEGEDKWTFRTNRVYWSEGDYQSFISNQQDRPDDRSIFEVND